MDDEEFKKKVRAAECSEQKIGASLARLFNCSLTFPRKQDREKFDYTLMNLQEGRGVSVEQKDSNQSKLCIEFERKTKNGVQPGWLTTCKADKLVWVAHAEQKLYFYDWNALKDYVVLLDSQNILDFKDYDSETWNHDSSPTSFCLIEFEDSIQALGSDNVSVYSFEDLNL